MHSPRSASARTRAFAVAACLALVAVACGDDDEEPTATADETTTTQADEGDGESSEYCSVAAELDESEEMPTVEMFEAYRDVAPEEISAEVDIAVDAIVEADGDLGKAFGDPAVEEAIGVIEDYEAEACGLGGDDEEGEEEPETEPIEGAQMVPVVGVDYAFEGIPTELEAGPTSFSFANEGEAAHEMFIARLGDGVDLDELLAADREPTEEEAQEIGGTFSEPGGETTYINAEDLEPGTYAVLCFIPGPEGKPHFELGMKSTFTVA
jgi:uncharacterized cupredoxin-like copper-binding protein